METSIPVLHQDQIPTPVLNPIPTLHSVPPQTSIPLPDFLTNPGNVLYLHPSETPSNLLVSSVLNGANYHAWSRSMKMALMSKNKLKIVDGSLLIPNVTDPSYQAWERCNNMVLGWIHKSISDSISKSILWIDKAVDAWKDLNDRFSQADIFRISDLQEEIYKLQQGDRNVADYFTELKILWDELEILKPLPHCTCSAINHMRKYRDRDHVIRFLKGLNEQFHNVRSQIMLFDPLPEVNKVFSLIL
ncbi:uncharacterized protein LOC133313819 [Gastrolobium bilobum]|uniref:uncharacterized protein LOC133313819 n=1 Tax=Gastrolobium bilobum TaxID=150636 RepID=UPI002AAF7CA6|nr:uncharacterized protein LOC133313819 [Gastrolobium bilobum]